MTTDETPAQNGVDTGCIVGVSSPVPIISLGASMTWLWTDDIAHALLECEVVARSQVVDWIERPFAVFVAEGSDVVDVGRLLLGATEAGAA